ncbi:methyltransferase domain-containing protein [Terriglobus albidus]|uniref:methyltransferase domain-containing protein n=1 Tax=Terriglobus albidus TaxID=1592106 RepID=UPI0021DF6EE6|nr:methyltransferase domain-containing protein [Terriglobus albidus]
MLSERKDFSQRAHLSEWMDEPCAYPVFRDCLRDLEEVNRVLSGYAPSLAWIEESLQCCSGPVHLLDVGSGGGGLLRAVEASEFARGRSVKLTGIDLNPHAAQAAKEFTPKDSAIAWMTGDVFTYRGPATLIVSSLLTHHLTEEQIVRFLAWMEAKATGGWFINDLRRSARAYYSFKVMAWALRWHRFVRHDGPVSVRRAFLAEDWERMCRAAGLPMSEIRIEEKPFARLCVSRRKL